MSGDCCIHVLLLWGRAVCLSYLVFPQIKLYIDLTYFCLHLILKMSVITHQSCYVTLRHDCLWTTIWRHICVSLSSSLRFTLIFVSYTSHLSFEFLGDGTAPDWLSMSPVVMDLDQLDCQASLLLLLAAKFSFSVVTGTINVWPFLLLAVVNLEKILSQFPNLICLIFSFWFGVAFTSLASWIYYKLVKAVSRKIKDKSKLHWHKKP